MKKRLIVLMSVVAVMVSSTLVVSAFGNKQLFDTTYTFNKAIISLPNGEIVEGKVDSWKDYEDGDQIQVRIKGVTYLVHSSNIALINE